MYDTIFLFYFLSIKHSIVNKIVEERVNNLLSKNSDEIKVDRSPWGEGIDFAMTRKIT